jgi:hypothetical protein
MGPVCRCQLLPITSFRKRSCVDMERSPYLPPRLGEISKGSFHRYFNAAGIALAFLNPWLSIAIYAFITVIWLVPDRRIEKYTAGGVDDRQRPEDGSCQLHRRQNPPSLARDELAHA